MIDSYDKKKLVFCLILLTMSVFLAILFCEIYLRFFKEYVTPETLREQSLQFEPALYARHVFPQKEQNVVIKFTDKKIFINEKGYRGRDFNQNKSDESVRIIIYGGSAVFDPNSSEGKDWPHQVEYLLRQNGFPNVEVINAGVPGGAACDSVGRFFAEGHIFKPNYVIIYNAWNDFKYFRFNTPILRVRQSRALELNDPRTTYKGIIDRKLSEISQFYVRVRARYYQWKFNIGPEGSIPEGKYVNEISEIGLKQYKLSLETFIDIARNTNAVPILMTQAHLVALDNTDEEKSTIGYEYVKMDHQTLYNASKKADEIVKGIAKSKNVGLIDASKILSGKGEFFIDFVHLSEKGSYNLAVMTANYLKDLLKERPDKNIGIKSFQKVSRK